MLQRFHVLCNQHLAPATAERWARVSTIESVSSKSRKPPLPMLRALAASHFVDRGRFRLDQVEAVFQSRPRTLSAGRRRAYQLKFEALFRRPYHAVLFVPENDSTSAMFERGDTETEPINDGVGDRPGAVGAETVRKVHLLPTPTF
jgi:hypothetical protein